MRFLVLINIIGKIVAARLGFDAPGTALALWFVPDFVLAYHLFVPRAQGLVRVHQHFVTPRREVWLTIDDGPDPTDTPRILNLLSEHGAYATFFVIGKNAHAYPELIREIIGAGHEVAHHTHTHPAKSFWCASPTRLAYELDAGLAVLKNNGVNSTRFRPPVGIKNLWLAKALSERELACIGWSARGLELSGGDADAVARRVLRGIKPGGILLLHEGPRLPATIRVEAIRRSLEGLKKLGYRCVIPKPEQLSPTA